MNFNTLTPTSKLIKKVQSYSGGHPVTSGDVPAIAIINTCEITASKKLVENVACGIKSGNAAVFIHNVPNFGYANKINPITAKYAESFKRVAAAFAESIIRPNMIDGVVIVTDCDTTAVGLLAGCLKSNCPALILPMRQMRNEANETNVCRVGGNVTSGKLTNPQSEEILRDAELPQGNNSFFNLLESVGFCTEKASSAKSFGALLIAATETGKKIVSNTKDLVSPKKLLTKVAYQNVVEFCLKNSVNIGALKILEKLFEANEVKVTHEFAGERAVKISPVPKIVLAKGSAATEGGYIQYNETMPTSFSGKAWVYDSLEDADRALLGGSIPSGSVVVVHNCVDMNVTALAYAIEGMGREKDIAIATDGVCDKTNVLAVQMCRPSSLANEEFANIQNGDVMEIDISRGRFNTSILAKDIKSRAKKNTQNKQQIYFV